MTAIDNLTKNVWDTIVIGGGQSGLATGYYLKQLKEDFLILDENEQAGDSWRKRWDSLRLFTPAWNNGMPGCDFPGPAKAFPTKDEAADFFEDYEERFDLPVVHCARVIMINLSPLGYEVKLKDRTLMANSVVIATGAHSQPRIPAFARNIRSDVNQLHSSAYKSPANLSDGSTLVVGAGTSGLQIALDVALTTRDVYVSGNPPARIPDFILKDFGKQFVWFATRFLNSSTPMGRKAREKMQKGGAAPLINISLDEVKKAGVKHINRLYTVRDGWPVSESGDEIHTANIIWCTGFNADYGWIKMPGICDGNGHPVAVRGVSQVYQGLYFVGSLFQYGLTSTWIGGVGRDANYISQQIHAYNKKKVRVVQ